MKRVKKYIQAFVALIAGFIIIGKKDFNIKATDHERFASEYKEVGIDNVFNYVNSNEVYSILKEGDGIIFFGYPENRWTEYYAKILNEAAKESNIPQILYYDFYEDRSLKNGIYQNIVLKLASFIPVIDDNTKNIYAPTLVLVKNGQIFGFDNETAVRTGNITPDAYWTSLRIDLKKENLKMLFESYMN